MESDPDDDPNIKYGTPIDIPEDKEDKLKFVPVHEQVVTDEEGRRRFHGAFTGGFSAGYYNTVGTKEGWTPSSFKSSRIKKSDRKTFHPEDFMDDEDKTAMGISTVNVSEEFLPQRRSELQEKQLKVQERGMTLALGADLLEKLIVPKKQTVGYKLLRKMGWRGDHGFGKRRRKKKQGPSMAKVYGCALPSEIPSSDSSDEETFGIEAMNFAPIDSVPESMIQKDNFHGIGYQPLNPTQALHTKVKESSSVKGRTKSGSKLSFLGQAFGVGAFEEDDDDIYSTDSLSNYDRILSAEKNPESTYGWTRPLAITAGQEKLAIDYKTKELKGFVPAKEESVFAVTPHPLPQLPPNFDPQRRIRAKKEAERIRNMNLSKTVQSHPQMPPPTAPPKYFDLTFEERRRVLADDPKPNDLTASGVEVSCGGGFQSIFDFISPEDRARMEAAKRPPVELGFKKEEGEEAIEMLQTKQVDPSLPLCDPNTLKPFSSHPEKQRRFDAFERAVRQRHKDPYAEVVSNLTEWERNRERDEFYRVHRVHNRLTSNSIGSRFTKGSTEASELDIIPKEPATAKLKVFGVMTRDKIEWHPDPLLCKRFNVPDPYPDDDFVGTPQENRFILPPPPPLTPMAGNNQTTQEQKTTAKPEVKTGIVSDTKHPPQFRSLQAAKKGRWDEEPVQSGPATREDHLRENVVVSHKEDTNGKEENQPTETLDEPEAPSMDLFKSIFADDDNEESSSSEEEKEEEKSWSKKDEKDPVETPKHISAAEILNRPVTFRPDETSIVKEKAVKDKSPERAEESDSDDGLFGPTLPPSMPVHTFTKKDTILHENKDKKSHKKNSKHKKHKKDDKKHKKKKKR